MVTRSEYVSWRLQSLGRANEVPVLFSHLSILSGPTPAPSPPTVINPVSSAQNAGDQTITISCQTASGRVIPGDQFTIPGVQGIYKVSNTSISSLDVFTNVQFTPGLSAAVTANTPVNFIWVNQFTVNATIIGAYKTQISDNGTIRTITKLNVPALNLTIIPEVGDKCTIAGRVYGVQNINPIYAYGSVVLYELLIN